MQSAILTVHMGYVSVYERDLIITVEKGKVIQEEIIDNTKKKIPSDEEKSLEELKKLKDWEDLKKRQ